MSCQQVLVALIAILAVVPAATGATIETVPIGNPGNVPMNGIDSGPGAVEYDYRIGKYEVTNAEYVEFLNKVDSTGVNTMRLYNNTMSTDALGGIRFNSSALNGLKYEVKPDHGRNPVVFVSYYDVLRFANWLHNGQRNGGTESGAYQLLGGTPLPTNWHSITRSTDAHWFVPSEDEWYKAAYFDPGLGAYYDYPAGSNDVPNNNLPSADTGNSANFSRTFGPGYQLTDVGSYAISPSPYGTQDQGGNVAEWNDTLAPGGNGAISRPRGGYWGIGVANLKASERFFENPDRRPGWNGLGFRVATIVPEPSGILLCLSALTLLLMRARART